MEALRKRWNATRSHVAPGQQQPIAAACRAFAQSATLGITPRVDGKEEVAGSSPAEGSKEPAGNEGFRGSDACVMLGHPGRSAWTTTTRSRCPPVAEARDGGGGLRQAGGVPVAVDAPDLTIEVVLLREDHIRRPQPTNARGRPGSGERRLVAVLDRVVSRTPEDILAAPPALPLEPFTTRELATVLSCSTLLAQRTVYCLRNDRDRRAGGHTRP